MSLEKGMVDIPEVLVNLMPAVVGRVNQYFGSFVRLNCTGVNGKEFELRVYMADWQLREESGLLADSDGLAEVNNPVLAVLEGAKFKEISVMEGGRLKLEFTSGRWIELMPNEEEYGLEDELLVVTLSERFIFFFPKRGFVTELRVVKK